MVVNPTDTLYYETESSMQDTPHVYQREPAAADLLAEDDDELESLFGVHRTIGLGFFIPNNTLYGLGEREDTLVLKRTKKRSPYELWAKDHPHKPNKMTGLYGNMPYV